MASQGVAANSRLAQMQRFDNESESNQQLIHDQLVPLKLNESWAGRRLIEALSLLPPTNFGASLDMRFQQKQLEEREQRRIEMTGGSVPSETSVPAKAVSNGRVRQMFDERRRGAGIDRSNPLKPIGSNGSRLSASSTTLNASSLRARGPAPTSRHPPATQTTNRSVNVRRPMPRSETFEQSANGNAMSNQRNRDYDEMDNLDNETFPKGFSSLSLNEGKSSKIGDRNNNNSSSSNHIRLNPVVTKKSPSVVTSRARQAATPPSSSRRPTSTRAGAEKPAIGTTVKTPPRSSGVGKVLTTKMAFKPPPRIVPPSEGMATCKSCKRNFLVDRLPKHEQVCQKMAVTRRKIFDAAKHRVQGTEAEKYLKKPTRAQASVKPPTSTPTAAAASGVKKTNWRKQHEEFIQSIRAAKQVQAYLAKGGKLSDLPPPPPSENPDYIQCPHCQRRFNQSAAERHIPKCATMMHNKPKPGAKKR